MIYVAVVSHGHEDIINELSCIDSLAQSEDITVVIKDNLASGVLRKKYRDNPNITVIEDSPGLGFGENNNFIFNYCLSSLEANLADWFLILNPDVKVSQDVVCKLHTCAESSGYDFSTINLYKDIANNVPDNNIRTFPSLFDFISSYIFGKNDTIINKSMLDTDTAIDWVAGSFLFIKFEIYNKLNGFDEQYFMYCEDIDICWRYSKIFSKKVMYIPYLKALHDYRKANRRFFSSHFRWHVKSMFIFLYKKVTNNISSVNKTRKS